MNGGNSMRPQWMRSENSLQAELVLCRLISNGSLLGDLSMMKTFESIVYNKRITGRSANARKAMLPLWGVTWNLRGKRFKPLGTASMMVMSYHEQFGNDRDVIELTCVTGGTDGNNISYGDIRMSHDFSKVPYEGAKDRILDPRMENVRARRGQHPNGSWVRLALELDRVISKSLERNWKRPVVPVLPSFKVGFRTMHEINLEVTPALIEVIASHMGRPVKEVKKIDRDTLKTLGTTHWADLWTAPGANGNDTGMWLIDYRFVPDLSVSPFIFEDFSAMMGVETWNPIRDVHSTKIQNPTRACAAEQGIDLAQMAAILAQGPEGDVNVVETCDDPHDFVQSDVVPAMTETQFHSAYDEAVDNALLLRNCVRGSLGSYARHFSDAELNHAVANPAEPLLLKIKDATILDVEDAVRLARQHLDQTRPLISAGTTDDDLRKAVVRPNEPLVASNMCKMQVLYRDLRTPVEEAFRFSSSVLGRERLTADLWAGPGWSPRKGKALDAHDNSQAGEIAAPVA